ncbi:maleylacetoacetate isomerase [Gallaecimonas sp. GXIMD4217]|uniref:maleylacetoacetate isomerase n=1 Tax=Gallaecimonas sp. GXIMD4217 TaxID=3131927 RepID=UPI00311AEE9E
MKLYGYWRSSAAYRVRMALNLKGLVAEQLPVHLVRDGGEQHKAEYAALNPAELVPTLVDGDLVINQSLAIIEYLDERYPELPLLPRDPAERAQVRALALDIACDVHPLNNLRVLQYLAGELGVSDEQKSAWYHHWIQVGFAAFEKRLQETAGEYCFGNSITLADLCLVPQVYNAERFKVDLSPYPTLVAVYERLMLVEAISQAAPEAQPDAVL